MSNHEQFLPPDMGRLPPRQPEQIRSPHHLASEQPTERIVPGRSMTEDRQNEAVAAAREQIIEHAQPASYYSSAAGIEQKTPGLEEPNRSSTGDEFLARFNATEEQFGRTGYGPNAIGRPRQNTAKPLDRYGKSRRKADSSDDEDFSERNWLR